MVARARVTVRASAKDVRAYTTEPIAHALQSDSIVAPAAGLHNPRPPQDIYLAQSRPGATSLQAFFRAVSVPAGGLQVETSGGMWKLTDARGKVLATRTPQEILTTPPR